jgi:hypothetical protein
METAAAIFKQNRVDGEIPALPTGRQVMPIVPSQENQAEM